MNNNNTLDGEQVVQNLNNKMMRMVLPVTVYIGIEAVIGFFGNILILLVYSRHYNKSNFRIFVLFMAMVDLTSCMTTLPLEMFSQMNWYTYPYGWMCSMKTYINVYTAWSSATLLLLLAYDRNRKICRPLGNHFLPAKAKKLCVGCLILSLSIATPILPMWGKQTYILEVDGMNLTVSVCEKSNQFKDTIYPFAYTLSVYVVPMILCVLVLMVLNIMSVLELFSKKGSLARMSSVKVTHGSRNSLSTSSLDTEVTSFEGTPTVRRSYFPSVQSSMKPNPLQKFGDMTRAASCDDIDIHLSTVSLQLDPDPNKRARYRQDGIVDEVFKSQTSSRMLSGHNKGLYTINSTDDAANIPRYKQASTKEQIQGQVSSSSSSCFISSGMKKMETIKRKTTIMLVLTTFFLITMTTYVILTCMASMAGGILKNLTNDGKVAFFFFWRLYFMNTIINPIVYGFLDPRFRSGLAALTRQLVQPCTAWRQGSV